MSKAKRKAAANEGAWMALAVTISGLIITGLNHFLSAGIDPDDKVAGAVISGAIVSIVKAVQWYFTTRTSQAPPA